MTGPETLRPRSARLVAGLISGALCVMFAATFGGLVFSGSLAPWAGIGISMAFLGAIVHSATIALTSSYRGSIGGVSSESAILGVVVAGVAANPQLAGHPQSLLATTIVIIASAALLTGAVCFALGRARLGNLIRYIPYPVIGGFVAGVGWLLLKGGMELSIGPVRASMSASGWLDTPHLWRWAPAFAAGVILLIVQKRYLHFLGVPIMLSVVGLLFFGVCALLGHSVSELRADGWLLGPFAERALWSPRLLVDALFEVRWQLLLESLPGIATYVVTIVIGMLLVGASMELVVNSDVELDRELRAAGWSNVLAGLGGGFPGYHYIGCTSLHFRMGAGHRSTGVIAAVVCLAALASGPKLLEFIPRMVGAVLLFFMGLDLLWTWLASSIRRLSRADFLVVLAVFVFVVAVGFMEGVMVGLILGIALFAFNYSRIDVVKKELDASTLHSRAARSAEALNMLKEIGHKVPIYRLEGYIFFGTVNRLLVRVRSHPDLEPARLHSVILDFRNVRGLDSSAAMYFSRLPGLARRRGFNLAIATVDPAVWAMLEREGLQQERRLALLVPRVPLERRAKSMRTAAQRVFRFETLDSALEWAENGLLHTNIDIESLDPTSMPQGPFAQMFNDPDISERFISHGQEHVFQSGTALTTQGEAFEKLYFIRSGMVDVRVKTDNGEEVRLKRMGAGSCVGEISMYLGGRATANVVAMETTEVIAFTRADLQRMSEQAPDVSALLHEAIAHTLAARLADSTRLIDILMH